MAALSRSRAVEKQIIAELVAERIADEDAEAERARLKAEAEAAAKAEAAQRAARLAEADNAFRAGAKDAHAKMRAAFDALIRLDKLHAEFRTAGGAVSKDRLWSLVARPIAAVLVLLARNKTFGENRITIRSNNPADLRLDWPTELFSIGESKNDDD